MKEYKPILVFYITIFEMNESQLELFRKEMIQLQERTGYEIIYIHSKESRAEIISVDKATTVEDIQKYIDLQSIKEKE